MYIFHICLTPEPNHFVNHKVLLHFICLCCSEYLIIQVGELADLILACFERDLVAGATHAVCLMWPAAEQGMFSESHQNIHMCKVIRHTWGWHLKVRCIQSTDTTSGAKNTAINRRTHSHCDTPFNTRLICAASSSSFVSFAHSYINYFISWLPYFPAYFLLASFRL